MTRLMTMTGGALLLLGSLMLPVAVADEVLDACGTDQRWHAQRAQLGIPDDDTSRLAFCPGQGTCDNPTVRDQYLNGPGEPFYTISLQINVLCDDAGSFCHASPSQVADAVSRLQAGFGPSGLRFRYRLRFINDSQYLTLNNLALPNPDDYPMKDAYATSPETLLNIWVTSFFVMGGPRGIGTYPWSPLADDARGGILIDAGAFLDFGNRSLIHEVGHNLGLWHTHRGGSSEVTQCGGCWESPHSTTNPSAALEVIGDFARDTAATDPNATCFPSINNDPCTGFSWSFLAPANAHKNFMGLAPLFENSCRDHFTPQQMGRMRCWLNNSVVQGWLTVETEQCADAQSVGPGTYYGTLRGAIPDGASSCGGTGNPTADVFYRYDATDDGPVTLSLCGSPTNVDTLVSVHTDCAQPIPSEVACSDDYPNCGGFLGAQGRTTFQAVAGTTYFIRVTHETAGPNDFDLEICEGTNAQCNRPRGPKIRRVIGPPIPIP